jgi:hypothetical protein
VLAGVVFGLVPALQSTRPRLADTLKDQANAVLRGGSVRLRKSLVVAQVALSLLLLIGAGLFLQSLRNLKYGSVLICFSFAPSPIAPPSQPRPFHESTRTRFAGLRVPPIQCA